jgi:hypothetical protein
MGSVLPLKVATTMMIADVAFLLTRPAGAGYSVVFAYYNCWTTSLPDKIQRPIINGSKSVSNSAPKALLTDH